MVCINIQNKCKERTTKTLYDIIRHYIFFVNRGRSWKAARLISQEIPKLFLEECLLHFSSGYYIRLVCCTFSSTTTPNQPLPLNIFIMININVSCRPTINSPGYCKLISIHDIITLTNHDFSYLKKIIFKLIILSFQNPT